MPLRPEGLAPYSPASPVLDVISLFRERGLATPFTSEVLIRAGVNESLVPRVLKSLEVLELIDDKGMPTAHLEGLRRATSEEFKPRLAEVVKAVYADVFQFTDPAKDDLSRVADAFRAYNPIGQRGRMVTLFMGLCEAAGIVPEGKKPGAAPAQRANRPARPSRGPTAQADGRRASVGPQASVRGTGGNIPPALTGLLTAIPLNGRGWTQAQKEKFLTTFGHVLDLTVPVVTQQQLDAQPVDEDE